MPTHLIHFGKASRSAAVDYTAFIATLNDAAPPLGADVLLRALWLEANDQSAAALRCVTDDTTPLAAWIQAYIHRKRGQAGVSQVWYFRAGISPQTGNPEDEWKDIVQTVLSEGPVAGAYGA